MIKDRLPNYKDYMVLLRPDERVCSEIKSLKGYAVSIIGEYKSMHSTAHISIMQYPRQKPYIIEQAIDNLQIRLKRMPPIALQINNFNFFIHKNDTYTIYAAIEPSNQSDKWFDDLRKQFRITKSQLYPHITIARTIDANCFFRLWPHFKYKTCRLRFNINYITILERESHNTQAKWSIFREVSFMEKNAELII